LSWSNGVASLIQQKSFDFALKIIKLYGKLQEQREFVLDVKTTGQSPQVVVKTQNLELKT
jgi:glutaredoxin